MGEYYKSDGSIQVGSCYGFRGNSNRNGQFRWSYPQKDELKMKKLGKNRNGSSSSSSSTSKSRSKSFMGLGLGDPELQRKKRVASYKAYSVEGKVKGSIRNTFRWLKLKYTQVIYGY